MNTPNLPDPSLYPQLQLPHSPLPGQTAPLPTAAVANPSEGMIQEALAKLEDIQLPDGSSIWPPAPGWWIGVLLLLVIVYLSGKFLYKKQQQRRRRQRYTQGLLNELAGIQRHWQKQQNIISTTARLSTLLRQFSLLLFTREEAAAISLPMCFKRIEDKLKLRGFCSRYSVLFEDLAYQDPLLELDMQEKKQLGQLIDALVAELPRVFKQGIRDV